jgi:GNAT superfamily N-acetyltransferase
VIGFLTLICIPLPHYSVPVAVSESFFVASVHRATGAGLALIREAERIARGLGALGLLISAPAEGRLAAVLDAKPDYRPTNRVFFKGLQ